jgi:hypothetical protein
LQETADCFVDLYWLPVGAGLQFPLAQIQGATLGLYERVSALLARRAPGRLYHSALKLGTRHGRYSVEVRPVQAREAVQPVLTGSVGWPGAGRFRWLRYEVACLPGQPLPDEAWAVAAPLRLTEDCEEAERVYALLPKIPALTWGRTARAGGEAWTSNSAISWLLAAAGLDGASIEIPSGGRAIGWAAGLAAAASRLGPYAEPETR